MRQFDRLVGKYLPEDLSAPMLDIGCGTGAFLLFLEQRGYLAAEGIDVSPEQIKLACARNVKRAHQGDVFSELAARSDYYSMITAFNVLEHMERAEMIHLMDFVVRALRPGGRFIAMVPNAKGLFGSHVRYADLTHELSFTPLSVLQLCNVVGLRVVNIFENGPVPHGVSSSLRWVLWQLIRAVLWVARMAEGADWKWPIFTQDLFFVADRPPSDKVLKTESARL